jgi:hypothetical protein
MTRRLLLPMFLVLVLTGCRWHLGSTDAAGPPPASCTPPAGGRCAADIGWPGSIHASADGRRLHGKVICGGTLYATETAARVTIRLHVSAMGPGTMSCAVPDIGVRLASALDGRTVVDAVTGRTVRVVEP